MAVNTFIVGRLKAQNSTGRASSQGQAKLGKTAATTPPFIVIRGPLWYWGVLILVFKLVVPSR